jgi:hypothetical protein
MPDFIPPCPHLITDIRDIIFSFLLEFDNQNSTLTFKDLKEMKMLPKVRSFSMLVKGSSLRQSNAWSRSRIIFILTGSSFVQMRTLEERGREFALKPLKTLPELGIDGDFMHTSFAKLTLLEFIMKSLLNPKERYI